MSCPSCNNTLSRLTAFKPCRTYKFYVKGSQSDPHVARKSLTVIQGLFPNMLSTHLNLSPCDYIFFDKKVSEYPASVTRLIILCGVPDG